MLLNSAEASGSAGVTTEEEPPRASGDVFLDVQVDPLAAIRAEAAGRLARELHDVRTALTASYDQAISRLGDNQWLPAESVTRLVSDLTAEAAAQRARATEFGNALESAKSEVERAREESQAAINAAREAAIRERKEAAGRFARGLNAAREAEQSATTAAANARAELSAVRHRCQEIVDSQMLQLVKFKRDLEQPTPKSDRVGTAAESESAPDASPPQTNAPQTDRAPAVVSNPAVTVNARVERSNRKAPGFDAIEAALADSPPLGQWPSRAAG